MCYGPTHDWSAWSGFHICSDVIKVCGAYVGAPEAASAKCVEVAQQHTPFFSVLQQGEIPSSIAVDLLTVCGIPKMNHLARTMPPDVVSAAMTLFDSGVLQTMSVLLRVSVIPVPACVQLSLPVALAGFGLRQYVRVSPLAYRASYEEWLSRCSNPLQPVTKLQKRLCLEMETATLSSLQLEGSQADQVRLACCTGPASWLRSRLYMTNDEWCMAARIRLGMPVAPVQQARCICNATVLAQDAFEHFTTCKKVTGYTTIHRHDAMTNLFSRCLKSHLIMCCPAPIGYAMDDSGHKPDVLLWLQNRPLSVDFSITLPTADTYLARSVREPTYSVTQREQTKINKHGESARSLGHEFVPLVWNAFGQAGSYAVNLMKRLSFEIGQGEANALMRDLSRTVQIGNARILLYSLREAQQGPRRVAPA